MASLNQAGIDLIKSFESLKLNAYPDPKTGAEPYTIGYGHTSGVNDGDSCTEDEAEDFLTQDLQTFCNGVTNLVTVDLNDNQFSSLVSFSYNCGLHNLASSTLLREINENNFDNILKNFDMWDDPNNPSVTKGLLRRRNAEAALFLS